MSVGVGNRRTADVYSPGYANLFLLDKKTLQEVVVNYPDAQESLKKKARLVNRRGRESMGVGKSVVNFCDAQESLKKKAKLVYYEERKKESMGVEDLVATIPMHRKGKLEKEIKV